MDEDPPVDPWILVSDALCFDPDLVLVGLYVGNDIKRGYRFPSPLSKQWYASYLFVQRGLRWIRAERALERGQFVDITRLERTDREFWFSEAVPRVTAHERYLDLAMRDLRDCSPPASAEREEEWQESLSAIAEIKAICDERAIRMLLIISPDHVQVSRSLHEEVIRGTGGNAFEESDYPQGRIRDFCAQLGIPCVDLLPVFRNAPEPDRLYLRGDNHWSAPGNELAARALADWLGPLLGEHGG